ncbi:MAG: methionyl-tRNA formyltransferase [Burkholderiales bacterium]
MRLIFAGTPDFAAVALAALIRAGHVVPLVLTQPDRPAGRGMKLHASPVKLLAQQHGIAVFQPLSLKNAEAHKIIADVHADVMIVAAFGLLLPQAVLDIPARGCLNIHASLLPRWRGAAPIHRAIEAGDRETGITIMQMDAGLDTGAMLLAREINIAADETTGSLHDKLARLGAECVVDVLARLEQIKPVAQPDEGVTYARKITKEEARIDWNQSAQSIERKVRAFNPSPVAFGRLDGENLRIWRARAAPASKQSQRPGKINIYNNHIVTVDCGDGALRLEEVQKAGGKRLDIEKFLSGNAMNSWQKFDA